MTDILINGINGRMGREVYKCAVERRDVNVVCGVDKHVFGDFNCPVYPSLKEAVGHIDAVIDFSSPSALDDVLSFCREFRCALILATTGYSKAQHEQIKLCAEKIPVCITPNTSYGINALLSVLPEIRNKLEEFDVAITETHRKGKKDCPSGTALTLANSLGGAEINSIRGGDMTGEHQIIFMGAGECIKITHTAYNRRVFADGALDACVNLKDLPFGIYDSFCRKI